MSFVVYSVERKRAVRLYERESSARALVTKNNKKVVWNLLVYPKKYRHYRDDEEYAYCTWAEFESIALSSLSSKEYRSQHEF